MKNWISAATSRPTLLLMLAACPVVASAVVSLQPDALPSLKVTRDRPALVFVPYLYHHGDEPIELNPTLESRFSFRNDGTEPVRIGDIERSCGCMTPQLSQREIPPGEVGSIFVPIQTINQSPGPKEFLLTVNYTDPQPRQAQLRIKAVFPEKMVVVQPKALYLSQRSEKPIPFEVTISDFREDTLRVANVASTAEFLDARLRKSESGKIVQVGYDDEPQSTATQAKIDGTISGNIPPGRHHALIVATTDDEQFPSVTVPVLINGPPYPNGKAPIASPGVVQLEASDHPRARRRAQIQIMVPSDWTISHVSAWPPQLAVDYKDALPVGDSEKVVPASVELTELPEHKLTDGVIQFFANDGENLITVPVKLNQPLTSAR